MTDKEAKQLKPGDICRVIIVSAYITTEFGIKSGDLVIVDDPPLDYIIDTYYIRLCNEPKYALPSELEFVGEKRCDCPIITLVNIGCQCGGV